MQKEKISRKPLGYFLVVAVALAGCSSLVPHLVPPQVELASIDVQDATLTAATLVFGVRVDNPNGFRIKVDRLTYTLKLNDKQFASGEMNEVPAIAARAATVVPVPARVGYATIFHSLLDFGEKGKIHYDLAGTVEAYGRTEPYKLAGNLDMPKENGPAKPGKSRR